MSRSPVSGRGAVRRFAAWRQTSRSRRDQVFGGEQQFRAVVENSPDLIARFDRNLRRTYVNPAIERLTGMTARELLGTTLGELNFDERFVASLEDAMREGFRSGAESTLDVRLPHASGERRYQSRVVPQRGPRGEVGAVLVISRDITSLHRSEERLRDLIATAHDAILTLHSDGRIAEANPAFERMMGQPQGALTGRRFLELVASEAAAVVAERLRGVLEHGEVAQIETALRTPSGQLVEIEATASRQSRDEGNAIVLIARDVTSRNRAQTDLENANRMAALGRVATMLSHQFNNVLMGIQPFAEVVLRTSSDERTREAARRIIESVDRGRHVTEDLRAFTHPAAPRAATIELGTWLHGSLGGLRHLLPPECQLLPEIGEEAMPVSADPRQLVQAVANVILNARDALGRQPGVVRVRATVEAGPPELRGRRSVCVTIYDDGEGIEPQALNRVTDPFYTTRRARTGLGLTTAQQIVAAHGGFMRLESELGKGTTVRMFLPLAEEVEESAALRSTDDAWPASLLLIEDDTLVADGVAALLEHPRRRVEIAKDGATALERLRTFRPDALVIDVNLPDCNGFELFERIARTVGALPVVFASGDAYPNRLEALDPAYRAELLTKPYDVATLIETLRSLRPEQ